MLKSVVQRFLP
uniref:Uncharacterized protein n=1 Tax=Anguilla anguilla TaxID=7936 RepID=A0A0E9SZZ0_ANGAN